MKLQIKQFWIFLLPLTMNAQERTQEDKIFHYSTMDAMRNAVYSGDLSIKELKKRGDFGLGTYNQLDGEMIALDGIFYRISGDGSIAEADVRNFTPFTSVTFFKNDTSFKLNTIENFAALLPEITKNLPSTNRFYAVKIKCTFANVTVGGANKVSETETAGLADLMVNRPIYKKENVSGTIVGFYSPSYIGGVDLSPFHFHFISDDRKFGGHLIEGSFRKDKDISVTLDEKNGYEIMLPQKSAGYQNSWKTSSSQSTY